MAHQHMPDTFTFTTSNGDSEVFSGSYDMDSKSQEYGNNMAHYPGHEHGMESGVPEPMMRVRLRTGLSVILRLVTLAACLAGFIVMITDTQTTTYYFNDPLLSGQVVPTRASAKWQYSNAFVWFVIATAIVSVYCLASALVVGCMASNKRGSRPTILLWILFLLDLGMVNILMSAISSGIAVTLIGEYGNKHTLWVEICSQYSRFCNHAIGALASGAFGLLTLTKLCILDAYHLHIQYKRQRV